MIEFSVAVGRYVIMPDHIHLFVRGGPEFLLSPWIGGLKRALSIAAGGRGRLWQPGFFDHILRSDEAIARSGIMSVIIQCAPDWSANAMIGRTKVKLSSSIVLELNPCSGRRVACFSWNCSRHGCLYREDLAAGTAASTGKTFAAGTAASTGKTFAADTAASTEKTLQPTRLPLQRKPEIDIYGGRSAQR